MGHTKPEMLTDIAKELVAIRALDRVTEKKPGIFYFKAVPFLHFHDEEGVRWADIKKPEGGWTRIKIDFNASAKDRKSFVEFARVSHEKFSNPKAKKR